MITDDNVVAFARVDRVTGIAAHDNVVIFVGPDEIGGSMIRINCLERVDHAGHQIDAAVVAKDQVVSRAGADHVVCRTAKDPIATAAGIDRIAASDYRTGGCDHVDMRVAVGDEADRSVVAEDDVVIVTGVNHVVELSAENRVVPDAGGDMVVAAEVGVHAVVAADTEV